ncbi:hypothetical protein ACQPZJ_07465 [Actinoplanes sp. CA-054009]
MGEPERRRRRVRPSHSSPAAAPPGADDETAEPPAGTAVTAPVADPLPEPAVLTPAVPGPPTPGPAGAAPGARDRTPEAGSGERATEVGAGERTAEPDAVPAPPRAKPADARPPRNGSPGRRTLGNGPGGDDREVERGLRGLVGSGSSQVSVGAALRARDAARPTDEHLADADANLTIVRRNWVPREDLPRNR